MMRGFIVGIELALATIASVAAVALVVTQPALFGGGQPPVELELALVTLLLGIGWIWIDRVLRVRQ